MDSIPRYRLPCVEVYNFPIDMGKERGDGGALRPLGTLDPQHAVTQLDKALADPARAFVFVSISTEVRPLG